MVIDMDEIDMSAFEVWQDFPVEQKPIFQCRDIGVTDLFLPNRNYIVPDIGKEYRAWRMAQHHKKFYGLHRI
jgi:hypothetical protein